MKVVKKILLFLLAIILLFISSGIFIGIYYGAEVKRLVINELNKHLLTQVNVKQIDFSVLKKFPYASVEFTEVVIENPTEKLQKDTLLKAGTLFLHFNLLELLKGKYNLKKIQVINAIIKPEIDQNGDENYIFWKAKQDKQEQNFSFSMNEVLLKNVKVLYTNYQSSDRIFFTTDKTVLSGDFSSKHYLLKSNNELFADHISFDSITYISKQPLKIKLNLDVNSEKNSFIISQSELTVADLKFIVEGKVENQESNTAVDLKINGKDINIKSLLSLLPQKYNTYTSSYSSNGNFYFNGNISGNISSNETPVFQANFGINNGEVKYKKSAIKIEKIILKGEFNSGTNNSGGSSFIEISNFNCTAGTGVFSGNFRINNFQDPTIRFSTVSSFDLQQLLDFFPHESIEKINGKVDIDASYTGPVKKGGSYIPEDFINSKTNGKMTLSDLHFSLKDNPLSFNNISAQFLFDNNDIIIRQLSGKISDSDFQLTGFFRNAFPYYFIKGQKLVVDAKLHASKINLNELLVDNTSDHDTVYDLRFSENASFYLDATINEIIFRKFDARNIDGKFVLKDKELVSEKVAFSSLGGQIESSVSIDGSNGNNFKVSCKSKILNIDLKKLFYQFENFGQKVMQDQHLKGNASAIVRFSADYDNAFNVNDKSIACNLALMVEKGELINFEPMKQLSSFIKVPDLGHIKFSTLENVIEIVNEKIYIPKMEINSSAIDISIAGVHGFNDSIDYRFRLLLRDLLAKKAKDNNKNYTEFGFIEEDDRRRMSVFLAMKGHIDDPKFSYDGVGLKEKMKEDLQTEKKTVKSLLKDEFGLYKSDSTIKYPTKKKYRELEIEWDENDKPLKEASKEKEKPSLTSDKNKKEKGKFGKWLDKVGNE